MTISSARSIAASGLALQQRRLTASATNVANATTDDYRATRIEPVAGVDRSARQACRAL